MEPKRDLFNPDFTRLRMVLKREGEPDRVPFYELLVNERVMEAIMGHEIHSIRDRVDFYVKLGYDYVVT